MAEKYDLGDGGRGAENVGDRNEYAPIEGGPVAQGGGRRFLNFRALKTDGAVADVGSMVRAAKAALNKARENLRRAYGTLALANRILSAGKRYARKAQGKGGDKFDGDSS